MQIQITKSCRVGEIRYEEGEIAELESFNPHCMRPLKNAEIPVPKPRPKNKKTKKSHK